MERYYFFKGQKRLGPFDVEQLQSLIANRTISAKTLVFTDSGEKKRAKLLMEQFSEKCPSDAQSADAYAIGANPSSDSAENYRWSPPFAFDSAQHIGESENTKSTEGVFCTHCGNQVKNNAVICPSCGFAPSAGGQYCSQCGSFFKQGQQICLKCGATLETVELVPRKKKMSDIDIGCLVIIFGIVLAIIIVLSFMSDVITLFIAALRELFR